MESLRLDCQFFSFCHYIYIDKGLLYNRVVVFSGGDMFYIYIYIFLFIPTINEANILGEGEEGERERKMSNTGLWKDS